MIDIRVQSGDFDPGRQLERLRGLGRGAVISLLAVAEADGDVTEIVVEHYAGMAKAELGRIADEANRRWPLAGTVLIHRHGSFAPGDRLFFIGVAASDPEAAQDACGFLAKAVRERAPFWRKEVLGDGGSRWTENQTNAHPRPV